MKNPHDIILRPVLTEKSYDGMADKRYVFEVAINANESHISTINSFYSTIKPIFAPINSLIFK